MLLSQSALLSSSPSVSRFRARPASTFTPRFKGGESLPPLTYNGREIVVPDALQQAIRPLSDSLGINATWLLQAESQIHKTLRLFGEQVEAIGLPRTVSGPLLAGLPKKPGEAILNRTSGIPTWYGQAMQGVSVKGYYPVLDGKVIHPIVVSGEVTQTAPESSEFPWHVVKRYQFTVPIDPSRLWVQTPVHQRSVFTLRSPVIPMPKGTPSVVRPFKQFFQLLFSPAPDAPIRARSVTKIAPSAQSEGFRVAQVTGDITDPTTMRFRLKTVPRLGEPKRSRGSQSALLYDGPMFEVKKKS